MDSSTRILVGIVAAVIVLVVLAIALPRLIQEEEADYPPNTPEGTVQRYIRAMIDEDVDTALALMTEENTTACVEDEIRNRLRYSSYDDRRVRLGDVEESGSDTVSITVGVTHRREPGLFQLPEEGNTAEYAFDLQRSADGFWLISDSEWPIALGYIREDFCEREPPPTPSVSSS